MLVQDDILTPEDVGKLLKISPRTAVRWAEQGKLPSFRLGDLWRFQRGDIEAYIEEQKRKQQKSN